MSAFPVNHYVLILQNNYTKQTFVHDVLNTSTDTLFYKFEGFEFDDKAPFGEYNYVLFWCTLDYNLELSNSLLDSKITVETKEGETVTLKLKDITPDTGIIYYPDPNNPKGEQAIDNPTSYYSL